MKPFNKFISRQEVLNMIESNHSNLMALNYRSIWKIKGDRVTKEGIKNHLSVVHKLLLKTDAPRIPWWLIKDVPTDQVEGALERYNLNLEKKRKRSLQVESNRKLLKLANNKIVKELEEMKYDLVYCHLYGFIISIAYKIENNQAKCYFTICSPVDQFSKKKARKILHKRIKEGESTLWYNNHDLRYAFIVDLPPNAAEMKKKLLNPIITTSFIPLVVERIAVSGSNKNKAVGIPDKMVAYFKGRNFSF